MNFAEFFFPVVVVAVVVVGFRRWKRIVRHTFRLGLRAWRCHGVRMCAPEYTKISYLLSIDVGNGGMVVVRLYCNWIDYRFRCNFNTSFLLSGLHRARKRFRLFRTIFLLVIWLRLTADLRSCWEVVTDTQIHECKQRAYGSKQY